MVGLLSMYVLVFEMLVIECMMKIRESAVVLSSVVHFHDLVLLFPVSVSLFCLLLKYYGHHIIFYSVISQRF